MSSTPPADLWSTQVHGETVTLPSTPASIRTALPPERRVQFEADAVTLGENGDLVLLDGEAA